MKKSLLLSIILLFFGLKGRDERFALVAQMTQYTGSRTSEHKFYEFRMDSKPFAIRMGLNYNHMDHKRCNAKKAAIEFKKKALAISPEKFVKPLNGYFLLNVGAIGENATPTCATTQLTDTETRQIFQDIESQNIKSNNSPESKSMLTKALDTIRRVNSSGNAFFEGLPVTKKIKGTGEQLRNAFKISTAIAAHNNKQTDKVLGLLAGINVIKNQRDNEKNNN